MTPDGQAALVVAICSAVLGLGGLIVGIIGLTQAASAHKLSKEANQRAGRANVLAGTANEHAGAANSLAGEANTISKDVRDLQRLTAPPAWGPARHPASQSTFSCLIQNTSGRTILVTRVQGVYGQLSPTPESTKTPAPEGTTRTQYNKNVETTRILPARIEYGDTFVIIPVDKMRGQRWPSSIALTWHYEGELDPFVTHRTILLNS